MGVSNRTGLLNSGALPQAMVTVLPHRQRMNPLLSASYEPAMEGLGDEYWDVVEAAVFPSTRLRYRCDDLLIQLGFDPARLSDGDLEQALGRFEARHPLLALRYHGYQFGVYNPFLGDGRGFLYGQLRDIHGQLQDLGTKGSGQTPWSRGGDGRLTLKGGVREIIACEALHRLGVCTSRTLSLVETGEGLYRGDEPSPTRSSVMVRVARTHLRFGSCERLLHLGRADLLERLLRHVVALHYPELQGRPQPLSAFYGALSERVARLAAEWMVAGFTHGVLNTDNMSLAAESFDYGPFAFLERFDPGFTAAYFDHQGLYAYGRQPAICQHNLRLLQAPLALVLPQGLMEEQLQDFAAHYSRHYRACLLRRLGFGPATTTAMAEGLAAGMADPVPLTLRLLESWSIDYGAFFAGLRDTIGQEGALAGGPESLQPWSANNNGAPPREAWLAWRDAWWQHWNHLPREQRLQVPRTLQRWNLTITPTRPQIERVWAAIDQRDDWEPLEALLASWRPACR